MQAPRERHAAVREEGEREPDGGKRDVDRAEEGGVIVPRVREPEQQRQDQHRRPRADRIGEAAQRVAAEHQLLA